MGCDIHIIAEKRREDGTWRKLPDPIKKCWSCDGKKVYGPDAAPDYVGKPCGWCEGKGERRDAFYSGRNYRLFAVLAGVRNDYGIQPIRKPRGLPKDGSPASRELGAYWGEDGHSASYLTLKEIVDHDWTTLMHDDGYVDPAEYKQFKEEGKPRSWCKGVGGGSTSIISNEEMDDHLRQLKRDNVSLPGKWESHKYTRVTWSQTLGYACENFLSDTVQLLKEQAGGDLSSVRIVFLFDN